MTVFFHQSQHLTTQTDLAALPPPDFLTAYEQKVWRFCHDWLSGQETFDFQTSGSTGTPKPIQLTRHQLVASAAMTGNALDTYDTFLLVCLHVDYIAGRMMLIRGLEWQSPRMTVLEPSSLPLASIEPTATFGFQSYVPLQLQTMLEKMPEKLPVLNSAKAILVGGGPVSVGQQEAFQQVTAPIYHTYGMTETVSHVALRRLNGPDQKDFYMALPGVMLQTDSRNCLVIDAPHLSAQPVVTNDVVDLVSENVFRWLGRYDSVINSGGVKVQAEKVERHVGVGLQQLGIQRRFLVGGMPHPSLGEAVTLIIEGENLPKSAEQDLQNYLQGVLPKYEQPKSILYLPHFTETPTGKIARTQTLSLAKF